MLQKYVGVTGFAPTSYGYNPFLNGPIHRWIGLRFFFTPTSGVISPYLQLSHEKNLITFHYTGWLIGILIVAYHNPYIPG